MKIKYFRNIKTKKHYKYQLSGFRIVQTDLLKKQQKAYDYRCDEDAEKAFNLLNGSEATPKRIDSQEEE